MAENIIQVNNDIMKFNSSMISSYRTSDAKFSNNHRLVRYHYASAATFPKILTNSSIRFTDVRFMNDHSEMVCCVKCLLEFLDKNRGKYPFCEEVVNSLLLKKHSETEYRTLAISEIDFENCSEPQYIPTRCFVFCMSEEPDSLNMWNYYVHNGKYEGYCIGFDIYNFLKSFDTDKERTMDPISIHYGKILYKKESQEKEITSVVERVEQINKHMDEPGLIHGMIYLRRYIESYGAFFKDESFKEEKEYRIVLEISENRLNGLKTNEDKFFNNNLNGIERDFFVRNGVLVPCLSVPINKNAITKITMSPIIEHKLAERSLREFLNIHGYNAEIDVSKIPIRF